MLTLCLLVVTAVVFTHAPFLNARAVSFDDGEYLIQNKLVQNPSFVSARRFLTEVLEPSTVQGYYQPLTMISLMLDYAVADGVDHLGPFHRTSLILHICNTLLVMGLLYTLLGRPWIAAGVALLFGVHPMAVEPIAWIGERKTLLAAFFSLLCLLAYVRYAHQGSWKYYFSCVVLYLLALMSKPTSTPIPLVLMLLDYWPLRRFKRAMIVEKLPFFVIAGLSIIVTVVSQRHLEFVQFNVFTAGETFLLMCHNLVLYPLNYIWPVNLSSLYPFPAQISLSNVTLLMSTMVCVIAGLILLVSLRWTRAVLVGCLCYGFLLAPTLLNKNYSPSIAWDKYAYLPAVGLLLLLGWVLRSVAGDPLTERSRWRPWAVAIFTLVSSALLMFGARRYIWQWATTERHEFYMHQLAPNSPTTNLGCGNVFMEKGDYGQAIKLYAHAIKVAPTYAQAYINRGNAYSKIHEYDSAIHDFTKAIELQPGWVGAYNNRGNAYNRTGEFHRAIRDFCCVIELDPDFAEAYNNRGVAYGNLRKYSEAIRDYSRAIAIQPDHALAYNNRAVGYFRLKKYDQAWADVHKCQELGGPTNPRFIKALTEATKRFRSKARHAGPQS